MTPEQAAVTPCPVARTFPKPIKNCIVADCPIWRWVPIASDDPRFTSAVKAVMKDNGGKHKEAVATVMADRPAYGIPTKPEHGYCGLGGAL